jgi:hypothetical protein
MLAADHRARRARHGVYKAAQLVGEPPLPAKSSRCEGRTYSLLCLTHLLGGNGTFVRGARKISLMQRYADFRETFAIVAQSAG